MSFKKRIVRQFHQPRGLLGSLAGMIMANRPSNIERNNRTVDLLDIQPDEHVLEIGFGPGLALRRISDGLEGGRVVGLDHSATMLRQASRRNRKALAEGKIELHQTGIDQYKSSNGLFDKVLAINVYIFWKNPVSVLEKIGGLMAPGGKIALTIQPRLKMVSDLDVHGMAERILNDLRQAGFERGHFEIFPLNPQPAVCAMGYWKKQEISS